LDLDGDNEIGPGEFSEAISFLKEEPKRIHDSPSRKPPLFLDRPNEAKLRESQQNFPSQSQ